MERIFGNEKNKLIIPPSGAIAYHLIYHWVYKTPLEEIRDFIYGKDLL